MASAPADDVAHVGAPAAEATPPARWRRGRRLPASWPVRRLVAAGALLPGLLALQLGAGGGWAPSAPAAWTALVVAVSVASATTLASYVPRPGSGARLDLGCSPCAVAAPLSVLAAAAVLSTATHDVPTAILALAAAGFGLRQRLIDPASCPAPPRDR